LKDVEDPECTQVTDTDNNGEDTGRNDDSVEYVQKPTESEASTSNTVAKKKK